MKKFAIFCDGSNLFGSLRKLNIKIVDYQHFYKFVFEESIKVWEKCTYNKASIPIQLQRTYWYVLGTIDNIDTSDAKFQTQMKEQFDRDKDLKKAYMAIAGQKCPGKSQTEIYLEAWRTCFEVCKEFYTYKKESVENMQKFYHSVRSMTDFIDVIDCGHWKVDFLNRYLSEKGLDTQLAIDVVTLMDYYDVGLIISGDADSIPSVNYVKKLGKQIGTIEFIKGYPPEKRGKQFSSRLKAASDFVVQIYEMDLQKNKIAVTMEREEELTAPNTV